MPPESFKAELAKETGVDENLATNITEALAKEVIGPVAAALRYARVDTNLLGFNAPAEAARPIEQPQPETSPVPATPKPSVATEPPVIPTPAPTPTEPFILHEEPRVNANTSASPNRQPSYAAAPEENLTGKIPPRVVIERVVHYSALRTPLNTAGRGSAVSHGAKPEPKLPQSKWFI